MKPHQRYLLATWLMLLGIAVAIVTAIYRLAAAKTTISGIVLTAAVALVVFCYLYRRDWRKQFSLPR